MLSKLSQVVPDTLLLLLLPGKQWALFPTLPLLEAEATFCLWGREEWMMISLSLLSLFFFLHILPLCKKHSHTQTTWPEKDLLSHELGRRQAWRLVPTEKSFICGWLSPQEMRPKGLHAFPLIGRNMRKWELGISPLTGADWASDSPLRPATTHQWDGGFEEEKNLHLLMGSWAVPRS